MKANNYHLYFVEGCSPRIKSFATKKELEDFCEEFEETNDDWLDFAFEGKITEFFTQHNYES